MGELLKLWHCIGWDINRTRHAAAYKWLNPVYSFPKKQMPEEFTLEARVDKILSISPMHCNIKTNRQKWSRVSIVQDRTFMYILGQTWAQASHNVSENLTCEVRFALKFVPEEHYSAIYHHKWWYLSIGSIWLPIPILLICRYEYQYRPIPTLFTYKISMKYPVWVEIVNSI